MTVVDANGVAATVSATLSVALAPPDCSRAVFSPAILTSRLNSQVCVAKTVGVAVGAGSAPAATLACHAYEHGALPAPRCARTHARAHVEHTCVCATSSASPHTLACCLPHRPQEARTGRQPRLATTVTLSLTDAQGAAAAVNVTSILLDKTTAGWQCALLACATTWRGLPPRGLALELWQDLLHCACTLCRLPHCWPSPSQHPAPGPSAPPAGYCRPSKRDNCSCVPDAALLGGGRFRVMPQWRRNTLPGALADTILQVWAPGKAQDTNKRGGHACSQPASWRARRT